MKSRHVLSATVLALLLGVNFATLSDAAERRLEDVAVEPQLSLGLSFPGSSPKFGHYKWLRRAGLGVVRLSAHWDLREPRPGQFSWGGTDQRIIKLQQLGLEPFITFESKSEWGSIEETKVSPNAVPKDIRQWTRFVSRFVDRYDGDGRNDAPGLLRPVRMYQMANEWQGSANWTGGWGGTTEQLIGFVNATTDAIKKQYPDAIVVLGGITSAILDGLAAQLGMADYEIKSRTSADTPAKTISPEVYRKPKAVNFFEKTIKPVLLQARYDVLDLHLYGPADHDPARIKALRSVVGNKPMLSAECGGPSMEYHARYMPEDHFMAVISRNMIILSENLKFCLWYKFYSGPATFGNTETSLLDAKRQPKPGFGAYILLAAALKGMERVERRGDSHVFVIHRKTGSPLMLGWAQEGDKNAVVKLPPEASGYVLKVTDPVRGLYEVSDLPNTKTVKLGKWPILVGELPKALMPSR